MDYLVKLPKNRLFLGGSSFGTFKSLLIKLVCCNKLFTNRFLLLAVGFALTGLQDTENN